MHKDKLPRSFTSRWTIIKKRFQLLSSTLTCSWRAPQLSSLTPSSFPIHLLILLSIHFEIFFYYLTGIIEKPKSEAIRNIHHQTTSSQEMLVKIHNKIYLSIFNSLHGDFKLYLILHGLKSKILISFVSLIPWQISDPILSVSYSKSSA